jgi:catechol 2,3-dioxygenase-like lactoylglutathione lyase family enzyme
MNVKRFGWLGTRTAQFDEMSSFFRDLLGLEVVEEEPGFSMYRLPGADHDYVEVFGSDDEETAHMTTGPVVGLVVDDIEAARSELEAAGIELIGPTVWSQRVPGYGWILFRGPDGNVYGMLQGTRALLEG